MASKVEIINLALGHLGQRSIASPDEITPSATSANNFWIPCRDDVFGEHSWPFANTTIRLAGISNISIPQWAFFYAYPSNAARVWYVFDDATFKNKEKQSFEVQFSPTLNKKFICSNLEQPYAEYTHKVEDTTIWDSKFVITFSYRLAASMAQSLTGDSDKAAKLMEIYNAELSEAKRLTGSEKIKQPYQESDYQKSRA